MFGKENGIIGETIVNYIKIYKNGYLYIGHELDKFEMLDNGVCIEDYCNFEELMPIIDSNIIPKIYRFIKN